MYELQIALHYLKPRLGTLAVSLISIMSTFVIALVVWLSLVFFSVQDFVENRWIEKMIAITSPLRITPNENFFQSYFWNNDAYASAEGFQKLSFRIKEKANASSYDPNSDPELPEFIAKPYTDENGNTIHLIQKLKQALDEITTEYKIPYSFFETSWAHLDIDVTSNNKSRTISQLASFCTFDKATNRLLNTLLDLESDQFIKICRTISSIDFDTLIPCNVNHIAKTQPCYIKRIENGFAYVVDNLNQPLEQQIELSLISLPKKISPWVFLETNTTPFIALPTGNSSITIGDTAFARIDSSLLGAQNDTTIAACVVGFYDPGILPIGGKVILSNSLLIKKLKESLVDESNLLLGYICDIEQLSQIPNIQQVLRQKLERHAIAQFYDVVSYEQFDFSKDILEQMKSDRNLFRLISFFILFVGCSNITSMLIILVHDKKKEIAILRALGAKTLSIASIFSLIGAVLGSAGALFGIIAAIITLKNIGLLLQAISCMQGFQVLHSNFYGSLHSVPISENALWYILIATSILAMILALIPAYMACSVSPHKALRGEE